MSVEITIVSAPSADIPAAELAVQTYYDISHTLIGVYVDNHPVQSVYFIFKSPEF